MLFACKTKKQIAMERPPNHLESMTTDAHMLRRSRWRSLLPLGVAVLFGVALVAVALANQISVQDTAERARAGRATDLALQAMYGIRNLGFLSDTRQLEAGLKNLAQGPISSVALLDSRGRTVLSTPGATAELAPTREVVLEMERGKKLRQVTLRQDGPYPTYEVVVLLKPEVPDDVRRWFARILANLPAGERSRMMPALGPGRVYFGARVTVQDDVTVKSLRRARKTSQISIAVAVLLLLAAFGAMAGERRMVRVQLELQRQQALAEMGEMAAVLAHEIRNPLGVIKGRAQVLLEDDGPPPAGALQALVDQSSRLERLVSSLLEFAHPAPPRPQEVDGEELLEEALEAVADTAVKRQIALVCDAGGESLTVDPDQLHRALVNLLRNAMEASVDGSTVTVNLRSEGGQSLLSVTDSGKGLPADLGDTIFKPFVTTRQEGSGLGLAIVRRIAEGHGGSVTAENVAGRGARITMLLPGGKA